MGIRWTSPSPVADGETLVTSFLVLVSDSEAGAQTLYEEGLDLCLECDVDEDGVPGAACGGADCDDEDASVFPGAEDAWYDGLDSDCAGNDDYDQDGDGDPTPEGGGGDCDDLDPSVYLGAEDEWYDGVDSDCAGDDDFDQDGDGYASAGFGGDDCNEADPAINPGAEEIVGDGIDQNCDGSDEAPASDDGGGDGADGSGGDGADGSGGDGEDGGLDTQSGDEGGLDVQKGRDDDFKACGGCSADPRGLAGLWTLGLAALWLRRRARPHGGAELR
jgi:hypothetical protein